MDVRQEALAAEGRIRSFVRETPVERSFPLSRRSGAEVFLKLENLQLTGSFKLRGAMNKLLSLSAQERDRGVVAASSGNHGAAVAYGLQALEIPGLIFVPEGVSSAKLEAIRSYGAEVRQHGEDAGVTEIHARRYGEEHNLVFLSPYNDPQVIGGQGTLGLELARQLEGVDAVLVALGGGGLISGVAGVLKALHPRVEVTACSPQNSAVMYESLRAGRILDLESAPTLSDGTAGKVEPGAITFDLCQSLVDRHIVVTEEEIRDAVRLIIAEHHTLIEGAAGVPVAAFLKERARFEGKRVVIVLCGANIALETLHKIL